MGARAPQPARPARHRGGRGVTRDEVIRDTGRWLADALERLEAMTPRQVAEQSAAVTTGAATVDEVEARVRAMRRPVT